MKTLAPLLVLALFSACKKDGRELPDADGDGIPDDEDSDFDTTLDDGTEGTDDIDDDTVDVTGPTGFVGSPCLSVSDCDYDGAVCLGADEGFPGGMCSLSCERTCPDASGFPTTFCVGENDLPESPLSAGSCTSQCDFGTYPDDACRDGYGCVVTGRYNEPNTERFACLPNAASDLSQAILDLAARDVPFTPTLREDQSPSTHPNLNCHIEDPVMLNPPIHGVDVRYFDGSATPNMLMSAESAHALVDLIDDVEPDGVDTVLHIGTYVCRVIGGTNSLSRHAYGDAIDIYGFEFTDGRRYTLVDDWVHTNNINSAPPSSNAGATFLWEAAHRWHDGGFWNIILTPEFNSAHDNHFHIDMTPGASTLRSILGADEMYYFGPAPYVD